MVCSVLFCFKIFLILYVFKVNQGNSGCTKWRKYLHLFNSLKETLSNRRYIFLDCLTCKGAPSWGRAYNWRGHTLHISRIITSSTEFSGCTVYMQTKDIQKLSWPCSTHLQSSLSGSLRHASCHTKGQHFLTLSLAPGLTTLLHTLWDQGCRLGAKWQDKSERTHTLNRTQVPFSSPSEQTGIFSLSVLGDYVAATVNNAIMQLSECSF